MSEEFKNMDQVFQQLGEDFKVTYDSAYWNEMQSQLDDHFMDDAFKSAASGFVVPDMPDLGDIGATLDDAFMDDAFKNAAAQQQAAYSASYFSDFKSQEADLQMNEAFQEATNALVVDYHPNYWPDADEALQKEGLHYEYNSRYWTEAKSLLDLVDRRQFFMRWSGVATILLLLSFVGLNGVDFEIPMAENGQSNGIIDVRYGDKNSSVKSPSEANYSQLISAFDANWEITENGDGLIPDLLDQVLSGQEANESNHELGDSFTALADKRGTESADENRMIASLDPQNRSVKTPATSISPVSNPSIVIPDLEVSDDVQYVKINSGVKTERIRVYDGNPMTRPHNPFLSEEQQIALMSESGKKEVDDVFVLQSKKIEGTMDRLPSLQLESPILKPVVPEMEFTTIEVTDYVPRPTHTFSIYASAGLGTEYGPSYLDATRRFSGGFEYMNMNYGKLNRFEFGLSAGINHARQTNLAYSEYQEGTTVYAEDYRSWFKVAYTDLFHFNANLRINYRIAPKHKFLFGFGYDLPIAVQTNVVGENVNGREGIYTSNNNWGITEGIEDDFRWSFGYQYELSKRVSANITGNLGMRDRTNNEHFGNDFLDQEYSLMIGLKYNLIRR